jgi:hypothetical protein
MVCNFFNAGIFAGMLSTDIVCTWYSIYQQAGHSITNEAMIINKFIVEVSGK